MVDESCLITLCDVSGKRVSNTVMAPSELERHFTTNHSLMTNTHSD